MEICKKFMRIFVSKRSNSGKMIPIWPDPIFRSTTLDVGPSTALCNFLQVGSRKIHRAKLEIDSFLPLFIIFLSGAPYYIAYRTSCRKIFGFTCMHRCKLQQDSTSILLYHSFHDFKTSGVGEGHWKTKF